ncbi:MAG TPA: cupredoxin family protein [Hyphomicrobiaceae bacterium]|nr:cupredoxin family protein [Hyphomicrobiaceae bacterium]
MATLLALAAAAFGPEMMTRASAHGDAHGGHRGGHAARSFEAGEPGDAAKPFRTIEIVMKEGDGSMSFAPDRVEARKGEQIKFVIRNEGQLEHELLIDSFAKNQEHKAEMEKHPDMDHDEPNGTRLKPAARKELIWRFARAGTFEFACLIPGHYEAGMKGVIVVQ